MKSTTDRGLLLVAKRALDLIIAVPLLILLSPIISVISILILINLKKPILFKQPRPGKNGQPFLILKFRTMAKEYDKSGKLLPDALRISPLGCFLRAHSFDELPELINVIKGDMSLVGPRPLLLDYLARYSPVQARRHEVVPGITGWAQVNGRNAITWEEKFEYDVWYVDNWSLWLDLKILWKTVVKVIRREGISHTGAATMPEFKGTNSKLSL